jgi:hypothetical protein
MDLSTSMVQKYSGMAPKLIICLNLS